MLTKKKPLVHKKNRIKTKIKGGSTPSTTPTATTTTSTATTPPTNKAISFDSINSNSFIPKLKPDGNNTWRRKVTKKSGNIEAVKIEIIDSDKAKMSIFDEGKDGKPEKEVNFGFISTEIGYGNITNLKELHKQNLTVINNFNNLFYKKPYENDISGIPPHLNRLNRLKGTDNLTSSEDNFSGYKEIPDIIYNDTDDNQQNIEKITKFFTETPIRDGINYEKHNEIIHNDNDDRYMNTLWVLILVVLKSLGNKQKV